MWKINYLFICAISLILSGCKEKIQKEVAYYSNGTLKFEVKLLNGKREGPGIEYFENGKVEARSFWKGGKLHGKVTILYEDGRTRQINEYLKGRCVESHDYATDGFLKEIRIYDSLGRVRDYFNYKRDGTRDFSAGTKDPIFILDRDTVSVGENYTAMVRLGNRQYNHVDVHIGNVDDPKIMKKTKPLPKIDSLTSMLRIKVDSVGLNEISGVVFERNDSWDSMDIIPFTHHFYVEEQSSR